jgi:tetratricopeptide (TPR) repeat protein
MTESNWENAIKSIMSAIKINKASAEYLIALGQCYLELDRNKEGLIHLLAAVRLRPSSVTTWQEFIRGLYISGFYEESLIQLDLAVQKVGHKPVLQYYRAAVMFATGKSKEGMLLLETALQVNVKHVKKLIELDPTLLQHPAIVELISRYKRTKKGKQ